MEDNKECGSLSEFLLKYRKERAMTQAEFASEIGIDRAWYVMIENGKKNPSPRTIRKIAAATRKKVAFIAKLIEKKGA